MAGGPAAEVFIDGGLARRLLEEQHPDLADLPIAALAEGWDNVILRLGDDLTIRLPRRSESAALMLHEQRWLPELAVDLPLPVPAPIRTGGPSEAHDYPWSWSIGPWFPGAPAEEQPPDDPTDTAHRLAAFLAALHRPAPADAPANPNRGIPLSGRSGRLHEALDELGDRVNRAAVLERWERLLATPRWPGPSVWLHGDVHPLNLIVDAGRLSAVIDFGDICAGDPASDLAVAWMMFRGEAREVLRSAARVDDDTWCRAQGWALALGVAFLNGDHRITRIGGRTVDAVLADDP